MKTVTSKGLYISITISPHIFGSATFFAELNRLIEEAKSDREVNDDRRKDWLIENSTEPNPTINTKGKSRYKYFWITLQTFHYTLLLYNYLILLTVIVPEVWSNKTLLAPGFKTWERNVGPQLVYSSEKKNLNFFEAAGNLKRAWKAERLWQSLYE